WAWALAVHPSSEPSEVHVRFKDGVSVTAPVPLSGHRGVTKQSPKPFLPTPLQRAILEALDGKVLRSDTLATAVKPAKRQLFPQGRGGLAELKQRGLVAHDRSVGFYRPDAPPAGWGPAGVD